METIDPIPTQTSANAREVGVAPTWSRISGILESEEPITRPFPMNITATASGDPSDRDLSVHFDIRISSLSLSQRSSPRAIVIAPLPDISEAGPWRVCSDGVPAAEMLSQVCNGNNPPERATRCVRRLNSRAENLSLARSRVVYFVLGSQRCWARSNSSTMLRICGNVHTAAVRGSSIAA